MCPVSRWRSRSLQVGYSKVMFHPDFIQAGTGESVHCGNFALIFLYRPSAYWASVTLNWDSAIPPSNNQITFGDASKFNLCMSNIYQIPPKILRLGITCFVLLAKPRFQVQMHAMVTQDHFFKLHLQDLMFCMESKVLARAHELAAIQVCLWE